MAKIAFGLATSHGPMLSIPPEYWADRVTADRENPQHFFKGNTYTFDEMVVLQRERHLEDQITPAVCLERHLRCQTAIRELADFFDAHRPDAVVLVGNDQMEIFTSDHVPALAMFWGDHVEGASADTRNFWPSSIAESRGRRPISSGGSH